MTIYHPPQPEKAPPRPEPAPDRISDEVEKLKDERDSWIEPARQESRNVAYYRGLVIRCGAAFGADAKTQDDGGVVPDVLCAKVPELVEHLRAWQAEAVEWLESVAHQYRSESWDDDAEAIERLLAAAKKVEP